MGRTKKQTTKTPKKHIFLPRHGRFYVRQRALEEEGHRCYEVHPTHPRLAIPPLSRYCPPQPAPPAPIRLACSATRLSKASPSSASASAVVAASASPTRVSLTASPRPPVSPV